MLRGHFRPFRSLQGYLQQTNRGSNPGFAGDAAFRPEIPAEYESQRPRGRGPLLDPTRLGASVAVGHEIEEGGSPHAGGRKRGAQQVARANGARASVHARGLRDRRTAN